MRLKYWPTCTLPSCNTPPPMSLLAKSACRAAWFSSINSSRDSKIPNCLLQLDQSGVFLSTSRWNDSFVLLRSSSFSATMRREKYWRRHNIFDNWLCVLMVRMLRRLKWLNVSPWTSKALKNDSAIKVQTCWRVRVIFPLLNLLNFYTITKSLE